MITWTCNQCHAEIPGKEKPKACPLCGQHAEGFEKGERADPSPEDKKYTMIYEEALQELERREEGCEPEQLKYNFCKE